MPRGGRGSFGGGWSSSRSRSSGRIKPPQNLPQKVVSAAAPDPKKKEPSKSEYEKMRDNERVMFNYFAARYYMIRATRAMRYMFGDPPVASSAYDAPAYAESTSSNDACAEQANAFLECLNSYRGSDSEISSITNCQFFIEKLHQCQSGSASA